MKSEFGHFAEWVLAANYHERGHAIEYLPEAVMHHYYVGDLAELRAFTRDFTTGEMRYFASEANDSGKCLLDVPPQWVCQGSWDRRLARCLLRIAARNVLAPPTGRLRGPRMLARTLMRWLVPAVVHEGAARFGAAAKVCWTFSMAKLSGLIAPEARLSAAFRNYVAALIDHQRLECIKSARCARTMTDDHPQCERAARLDVFAPGNAGFYPIEICQGTRFRWSETAAIMSSWMPAGQHRIRIECLPVRSLTHGADLRFYLDEQLLPARDVTIGPGTVEIRLDAAQSGHSTLAWTCLPFPATGDRRWLGLPITRIVCNPCDSSPAT